MIYKLLNEGMTCYLEQSYSKSYNLVGVSFEKEPHRIYVAQYFSDMENPEHGDNFCYISDYLTQKLNKTVKAQLDAYLKAHAYRYDMYKPLNREGQNRFYNDNLQNLGFFMNNPTYTFGYDELINGVVSVTIGRTPYKYNLRTNELSADKPLLFLIYKDNLDLLVAKEQIKLGIAPPALTELANLTSALSDKQTVTFVFKDGDTKTLRRSSFNISDVLSLSVEDDVVACSPINYVGYSMDDVDYLKLGKVKYYFNPENLKELHQPAVQAA